MDLPRGETSLVKRGLLAKTRAQEAIIFREIIREGPFRLRIWIGGRIVRHWKGLARMQRIESKGELKHKEGIRVEDD